MLQAPAFLRFRETVTVWPDDTLFYRFYPISELPRVRRGADGLPALLLVEYTLSDTDRAEHPELPRGGGYLTVDTDLSIDDETTTELHAELQKWVHGEWERLRAGTPAERARPGVAGTDAPPSVELGTPTWTKGTVHLDAPRTNTLVEARIAEGEPTLLGGNAASFSLDLTPAGATFVHGSLVAADGSAATHTSPLQVGYDLTFWARLPPASIHVGVDLRRAYDYARKQVEGRGVAYCTTYDFDHTDLTTETISQSGAVTVQIDTGSASLPPDVVDALRGYALDLVKQLVASSVFTPAGAGGAAGSSAAVGGLGATPYVLRHDERFTQELSSGNSMTLSVDLTQSSVVEWTVHPQATLQTDLGGAGPDVMRQLVRRVRLDDDFFDHLDVTVRPFADFTAGISHVEVELSYSGPTADGTARETTESFTFTGSEPQRWTPGLIGTERSFRYRWRAVLVGHPAPEFGDWTTTSQPAVTIAVPPPGLLIVDVVAGNIDFGDVVAQAQVELAYEDPAAGVAPERQVIVLHSSSPSGSYRRQVGAPVTHPARYRVGWVLLDGSVRPPGDWQDVPGPVLLVNQPATPVLRVSLLPGGNAWADVAAAVVDVRYRDDAAGVDETREVTFTAVDQFRTLTFLVPAGGPRTFDHRRHVSYRSGRFDETPWTTGAADPIVPVVLMKAGFDVIVDGSLLDSDTAPLTEVTLTYAEVTPPQQATMVFHQGAGGGGGGAGAGGGGAQTWHVDAPTGAPVTYTWQVTHHPRDHDAVTLPPVTEHDTVVVLPPYRVSGELAVDVIATPVDFDVTPLVAVDLSYDDDANAYHQTRSFVLTKDDPRRITWRLPTKDARRTAFGFTVTYFAQDGTAHPGPAGTSTVPRLIVAAFRP
jgi:hypothetical protein